MNLNRVAWTYRLQSPIALIVVLLMPIGQQKTLVSQELRAIELLESNYNRFKPINSYNLKLKEIAHVDQDAFTIDYEIAGDSTQNFYCTLSATSEKIQFACQNPTVSPLNTFSFFSVSIGGKWAKSAYLNVEITNEEVDIATHLDLATLEARQGAPYFNNMATYNEHEIKRNVGYASTATVLDSELDGIECFIVELQFEEYNSKQSYFIAKDDFRMLKIETAGKNQLTRRRVTDWHETAFGLLPKKIDYLHRGVGFNNESKVEIVFCSINDESSRQRAQEMRSLKDIQHFTAGTYVTWRDESTFPCKPGDVLVWDGAKFLCRGPKGSSVAFDIEPDWKRKFFFSILILSLISIIGIWVKRQM